MATFMKKDFMKVAIDAYSARLNTFETSVKEENNYLSKLGVAPELHYASAAPMRKALEKSLKIYNDNTDEDIDYPGPKGTEIEINGKKLKVNPDG